MENRNIWIPRNVLWGFFFFPPFGSSAVGRVRKTCFLSVLWVSCFLSVLAPRCTPAFVTHRRTAEKRREWAWLPRWSENVAPGAREFCNRCAFCYCVYWRTYSFPLRKLTLGWSFSPFKAVAVRGLLCSKEPGSAKIFFFFVLSLKNVLEEFQMGKKKTYTLQRKRRYLSHMTSSGTAPQRLAHMHRELWLKRAGQVRRTRWPLGGIWEAGAIGQNDLLCMWAGLTGRKRQMRTEYILLRHGRKESFKNMISFIFTVNVLIV